MTDELEVIEQARTLPAVQASEAMVSQGEVSVEQVVAQRDKIKQVMEAVMTDGVHYGKVPGVNKPTLLKPGAEVMAVTFRLSPSYVSDRTFHDGGHLTVVTRAVLTHIPTGYVIAEGEGLCTTYESKYAYRQGGRTCPECGTTNIKKSKFPPKQGDYQGWQPHDPPGWYCFAKLGGCGANYAANDPRIGEDVGKVANPDLPDTWNTVLKMANKRALVAAILNGTAASDIFTQDVEDAGAVAADRHERTDGDDPFTDAPVWNKPKDWQEIIKRLYDRLGQGEQTGTWIHDAMVAGYGVDRIADVDETFMPEVAERLCRVIKVLDDADIDPAAVGGVSPRPVIQAAFAAGFEGVILDGPEWRLGPDETDRLTRDEYEAAETVHPDIAPDGEDIPFGDEPATPQEPQTKE